MKQYSTRRFRSLVVPAALVSLCWASLAALAQENPLAPANPLEPANPLAPANPLTGGAGAEKVFVPEFIKPGARFVYEGGSASQPDFNKPASAGVGLTRFEVIAVSDTKVILRVANYLRAMNGNGHTLSGSSALAVDAFTVKSGGAIWIDKNILMSYANDGQTKIVDAPWPIAGRNYEARSVTTLGNDSASRFVWDRGTGLLLANQICSGALRPGAQDPFMRQNTSNMSFRSYRQVDVPWANAPFPDWATKVRKLSYRGQQTLIGGVGPSITTPFRNTVEFTERGDNWAIATSTMEYPQQPPAKTPTAVGPASIGGYWMNPQALGKMQPGVIDQDEAIGCTTSYQITQTPMGRFGVLTEANAAGTYRVNWAYDLNDGALVYASMEMNELNMKLELMLEGRE